MRVLADTNIFGIAVDSEDERRNSVWDFLKKVSSGDVELNIANLTGEEVRENPHKPTREKELELINNLVENSYGLDKESKSLSKELEDKTSLDVIDAHIVAISITKDLVFWSGDHYILREKTVKGIKGVIENKSYEFKYRKE